ncbi:VOC family protein [Myxococcus sp. AM011]|uniref:VOC family protein n=1 Tax=Myxococcus sp. AM011 TaxID=2745200 RepID=UPI001595B38F|nr:VOC family protein [Myxococcus sp. AM011]NVJ24028.1 VOC family protein [Myxococcus sp. AM011]
MPRLDHLSVIAPSLVEGVAHLRECLGIDLPFGRKHTHMSTHNHLLQLGEAAYLEVIAIDEEAPAIPGPRWFGLDDRAAVRKAWDDGRRLRGWVASTDHFAQRMARHPGVFGEPREFHAGASSYFFSVPVDGSLPMQGVVPSLIDRKGKRPLLAPETQRGCELVAFTLEHPDAARIARLYGALEISGAPAVTHGEEFRYTATIRTPSGIRILT